MAVAFAIFRLLVQIISDSIMLECEEGRTSCRTTISLYKGAAGAKKIVLRRFCNTAL